MGKEEEEEGSPGLEGADMPGLSFLAMAPADMGCGGGGGGGGGLLP